MTNRGDEDAIVEVSSPACSIQEADDVYMGYAGTEALADFIEALLAADVEERWRAMLNRHLIALGAKRPPAGDGTATAVADPGERATHDHGGIILQLRAVLPKVRNDRLHADLTEMLRCYEADAASADGAWPSASASAPTAPGS